jgi:putative ABC transport system permease protein
MSLALASLLHEWRRYLAAVVALAFSGLLVMSQVGLFTGLVASMTATVDRSRADLLVLGPKAEALFGGASSLPQRVRPQIYLDPDVVEVASFDAAGARWSNLPPPGRKQSTVFVQVRLVDPRPGAVTLPIDYSEDLRIRLMEPLAVAVDRTALQQLGVALGDHAIVNGRTVRVAALLEGYADINSPAVIMSRDSMRLLKLGSAAGTTGPLMVRLRDPAQAMLVRDRLNARSQGAYRAWTRDELSRANERAFLQEQIFALFLGFSMVLGFGIGVGITSMTLRGAILSSIKEFASLRALGVPMRALRGIVMELSLWVGVAGLALTAALTSGVFLLARAGGVPMAFPIAWQINVAVLLLVTAAASGFFSLGMLKKSQPADLLR